MPAFDEGQVDGGTVLGGAVALLAIGLLRGSTIVMRRYFAAMLTFRTQRDWRRKLTGTYLEVPLGSTRHPHRAAAGPRRHRHHRRHRGPQRPAVQHRRRHAGRVRRHQPGHGRLDAHAASRCCCSPRWPCVNRLYTTRVERADRRGAAAGRRGVGDRPRELRRRAGREDARPSDAEIERLDAAADRLREAAHRRGPDPRLRSSR